MSGGGFLSVPWGQESGRDWEEAGGDGTASRRDGLIDDDYQEKQQSHVSWWDWIKLHSSWWDWILLGCTWWSECCQ
jgi:hypothetical protein